MDTWGYGYVGLWIHGIIHTCMWDYGCMGLWMHGIIDAWNYGYVGSPRLWFCGKYMGVMWRHRLIGIHVQVALGLKYCVMVSSPPQMIHDGSESHPVVVSLAPENTRRNRYNNVLACGCKGFMFYLTVHEHSLP